MLLLLVSITRSASRSALVLTPAAAGFFAAPMVDAATKEAQKKENQEVTISRSWNHCSAMEGHETKKIYHIPEQDVAQAPNARLARFAQLHSEPRQ